jgi:MinD superfamily P-loop ATPase
MLKQVTVLSGKGGTGKTTLVASFAALAGSVVVADCDVDAPNLHMLLNPEVMEEEEFRGGKVAILDDTRCIGCGACEKRCRFGAIKDRKVDHVLCEGCGVCAYVCPAGAIGLREKECGHAYISKMRYGFMSHARLKPGEENSGKLVTLVRQRARQTAEEHAIEIILNDGPPGVGCPAIASLNGVDLGIVVVEPTLSGVSDMKRVLKLLEHFRVKPAVCINKYDLNTRNAEEVEKLCKSMLVEVIGKVPFDPLVTEAMVFGRTVVEHSRESEVSVEIMGVWREVSKILWGG